jgi:hypothetical protein
MKKLIYILTAVMLLASCDKSGGSKTPAELLCNQWHSVSLTVSGDIYLDFTDDGKFEMYQKIGEGAYRLYRGTWNVEEDLLTGRYNDGEEWATAYRIAIEGSSLTMTSLDDAAEVSRFSSCTIPEEVKKGCETVVKSY